MTPVKKNIRKIGRVQFKKEQLNLSYIKNDRIKSGLSKRGNTFY